MDWQLAIDKNREKLLRIILALMASLGLVHDKHSAVQDKRSAVVYGGKLTTLPFYLYRKALLILRPAEAAVRRLIMMAAYEMELRGVKLRKSQAAGFGERSATAFPNAAHFAPSFNLIDPLKIFTAESPDYSEFGPSFDDGNASSNRTPISAASLGRRLLALKRALDTIDKQAKRLTRWYAQRDEARKQNQPHRMSPLRPGFPPGYRKSHRDEIMSILLDCHYFAFEVRERRDSS